MAIARDPEAAAATHHDLVVVGGGVYGIAILLEAARRGLRGVLVEREDFGGATSRNHLRILHGGLRYLQRLDLVRHRESTAERRYFLHGYPGLAEPLPCLMPLYGDGVRRPAILRAALAANDVLARTRNRGVPPERQLPPGRVLRPEDVARRFPAVRAKGLRGAALWTDGFLPSPQRLLMEILHRAVSHGGTALNYVEATGLLNAGGRACGVEVRDQETGRGLALRAPVVVNAAGPWCRELAERFDVDHPELFRPTLAWNLLLRRPPLAHCAVGVAPPGRGAQTYFLVPWQGRMLAGTGHAADAGPFDEPAPTAAQQQVFLDDLNAAVPGLALSERDVVRVYAGRLPGTGDGGAALADRPVIFDHGQAGGPAGLWSVSGVKFTTARGVADATLERTHPGRRSAADAPAPGAAGRAALVALGPGFDGDALTPELLAAVRRVIDEESVLHLDDLLVRRTSLADDPAVASRLAPTLCTLFDWDAPRRARELDRLKRSLGSAVPGADAARIAAPGEASR